VRNASRQHAQRNFKGLTFGTPGSTTPPALSMTNLRASGLIPDNNTTPWKTQATANDSGVGVVPDSGLGSAVAAAKCGGFTCMRVCLEVPDQETCDDMKKQFEQSSLVSECKANGCGLTGNFILAHDHRLKPRGDREQVLGHRSTHGHAHRLDDLGMLDSGLVGNLAGGERNRLMESVQIEVHLEAVAGRQHEGPVDPLKGGQCGGEGAAGAAEPLDLF
jgi:hypothetical protein